MQWSSNRENAYGFCYVVCATLPIELLSTEVRTFNVMIFIFYTFPILTWKPFVCRRYKEKKEVVEPEADPERDQRTVFAYQVQHWDLSFFLQWKLSPSFSLRIAFSFIWWWQMPLKATERDVYEFFSKAGKVGGQFSITI